MTPEEILSAIATSMMLDASYTVYIQLAKLQVAQSYFGASYSLAVALMAAHMWTLNKKRAGESGVITYRSEGRLMQSFGGVGVIRNSLELTNYGMQYKELITTNGPAASTTAYNIVTSGLLG